MLTSLDKAYEFGVMFLYLIGKFDVFVTESIIFRGPTSEVSNSVNTKQKHMSKFFSKYICWTHFGCAHLISHTLIIHLIHTVKMAGV